jgi:hypothetical protein
MSLDGRLAQSTAWRFHARVGEVEPGVHRAEYRWRVKPDDPTAREWPDFHRGTNRAGVKM